MKFNNVFIVLFLFVFIPLFSLSSSGCSSSCGNISTVQSSESFQGTVTEVVEEGGFAWVEKNGDQYNFYKMYFSPERKSNIRTGMSVEVQADVKGKMWLH